MIAATHFLVAKAQDTLVSRAKYDMSEHRLTTCRVGNIKHEERITVTAKKILAQICGNV